MLDATQLPFDQYTPPEWHGNEAIRAMHDLNRINSITKVELAWHIATCKVANASHGVGLTLDQLLEAMQVKPCACDGRHTQLALRLEAFGLTDQLARE